MSTGWDAMVAEAHKEAARKAPKKAKWLEFYVETLAELHSEPYPSQVARAEAAAVIADIQMEAWVKASLCALCGAGDHETTDHTRTCGCPCHGNGPPPPDYSDPREAKERP